MFIITPATVLSPGTLETRNIPKRFFGRVLIMPRRGAGPGLWLRLLVEMQFLRYMTALLPFIVVMIMSRDMAAPIMQAPIAMFLFIAIVEMKGLRLSDKGRARLMDGDEAARRLDLLQFRARAVLREVAARKGLDAGALHLVVEQSELARIPALTFVSVQTDQPKPHVMDLDAGDRAAITDGLFGGGFSERDLHRVNMFQDNFLRNIRLEARGVTAHARLAAWIDKAGTPLPEGA
jgi:hypothetical protein